MSSLDQSAQKVHPGLFRSLKALPPNGLFGDRLFMDFLESFLHVMFSVKRDISDQTTSSPELPAITILPSSS